MLASVLHSEVAIFQNNLLVYNGVYYQIEENHKEFCAEKTQDEDYYVLTLAAIARELDGKGMNWQRCISQWLHRKKRYSNVCNYTDRLVLKIFKMLFMASISLIAVLGDEIRIYVPINLIFIFLTINVGIIFLRNYLKNKVN